MPLWATWKSRYSPLKTCRPVEGPHPGVSAHEGVLQIHFWIPKKAKTVPYTDFIVGGGSTPRGFDGENNPVPPTDILSVEIVDGAMAEA